MTPVPNRMRLARWAAAAMNTSGELMISLPAEWCSPIHTSSKPTLSRCSTNSRSRCSARVGLVPTRWNGAMKYPKRSLPIPKNLARSAVFLLGYVDAECPSDGGQQGAGQLDADREGDPFECLLRRRPRHPLVAAVRQLGEVDAEHEPDHQ